MSKTIDSGQKECCNWQNSGCNPRGKQTSVIEASIRTDYTGGTFAKGGSRCGVFVQGDGALVKHTAGGYLIVNPTTQNYHPDNVKYYVESYTHDHKLVARYTCPPKIMGLSPKDFIPGPGAIFEALIGP